MPIIPGADSTMSLGPYPPGTVIHGVSLIVPGSLAANPTITIGLTSAVAASLADIPLPLIGPVVLPLSGCTCPNQYQLPLHAVVNTDQRFLSVSVQNGAGVAALADATIPAALPLDDVPLPPPPPSRSRRPDPATKPRSGQREGRGDDVFVGMVKRALAEFFANNPLA